MLESSQAKELAVKIATGLYPHQVDGVAFLMQRRRAILADDMGLGKTRQAIVAASHLEQVGPYLVVCPASVKQNWVREIEIVEPDAQATVVGPKPPPELTWRGWIVINYDILERHFEDMAARPWKAFVFDEAHYMKNHTSKRSRLCRKLVEGCGGDPVVLSLTGTPLTNRPRDLFPLLQISKHPMGRSFLSFAKRYCAAEHNGYGWVTDGASNLEELTLELHGLMLRRRKDEVLELPPKTRTWLDMEVPEGTARKETAEMLATLVAGRAKQEEGKSTGGQERIRLLGRLARLRRRLATVKAKTTIEFIENAVEQGEKVLAFTCFTAPLERMAKKFGDSCVVLSGETPTNKRQGLVDRFQKDPSVRVFVANILAGGVGLNLTAAQQVVFNDLDWVPANHWQAEDRAYRIGQTGTVQVTYMVARNTIDEFVRTVLETKAAVTSAVVEGLALAEWVDRDVIDELSLLLGDLSPKLAPEGERVTEDNVVSLLRAASERFRGEAPMDALAVSTDTVPPVPREALEKLIAVLEGPTGKRYRVESKSKPGESYVVEHDGADFLCNCKGFEYRGTCSHMRAVKAAVTAGDDLPDGIEELSE